MPRHAERDMYHGICAHLMSSTIDVTVTFVVHAKTLRTFCLAWRARVACQGRAKQGTVKYEENVVKAQRTVLKPLETKLFRCPIVSKELRK